MRILWISNAPWTSSGYGVQTRLVVPRLRRLGHEVALMSVPGLDGGPIGWEGIPVFPRGTHPFGQDLIARHYRHFKADIAITLLDAWVVEPRMFGESVRWVAWFPSDHESLPERVTSALKDSWARFSMSRSGCDAAERAGLRAGYIPLIADTKTMRRIGREEKRAELRISSNAYLVGMVAANQSSPSRKSFPASLEAFARFRARHPEALLYIHSLVRPRGPHIDLVALVESLGIGDAVLFGDQYEVEMGVRDVEMARLFSAFDVLLAPSMGEGFGLPVLEAQACGCPVVTGAWTATEELFFAGSLIPRDRCERFWTPQNDWQFLPHTAAVDSALEDCWERRGAIDEIAAKARAGAMAYDVDEVVERYWRPALTEIESRIERGGRSQGTVVSVPGPTARNSDGEEPSPERTDERALMDLSSDWTERTGYFGAALGVLYGLAVGQNATRILEVGVRFGGSTRAFLLAARRTGGRVWSIDVEDRSAFVPSDLKRWWTHLVGKSVDVARSWTEEIDLLFLDGEHNYETVTNELATLGGRVRSGGLIVLDDVWDLFPGVKRAFLEYPHASSRFFVPYGVPQSDPGGRDRTFGVIRKS
jgi:glycosyltransferase involved in cell wall biosynthesis